MGRSWQYPPWRRTLMQVALGAILGCTVGVAKLVTNHMRSLVEVPLAAAREFQPLSVKLPASWYLEQSTTGPLLCRVKETHEGSSARTLEVRQRQLPPGTPLADFMEDLRMPDDATEDPTGGESTLEREPVRIAGAAGELWTIPYAVKIGRSFARPASVRVHRQVVAAAVLPSGLGVMVTLSDPTPDRPNTAQRKAADMTVVEDVAASIQVISP